MKEIYCQKCGKSLTINQKYFIYCFSCADVYSEKATRINIPWRYLLSWELFPENPEGLKCIV